MPEQPEDTRARPSPLEHILTVRRDSDLLTADWDHGDPFPLPLPLAKADLDELAWYLERYIEFPGAGDRARARSLEQRLADWGLALGQAIFPGDHRNAVYADIRDRLDQGQRVLLTLASDIPAFLIRPWEILRDPRGSLALRGLTLRRRLPEDGPATAAAPRIELPLRLLVIVSRPKDTDFIDPRTSVRPTLDALSGLMRSNPPAVAVDFCEPPTFSELGRRLAGASEHGAPYHIVHFDGHGQYYPETAVGVLCFENHKDKTELIDGREFGGLLSRFQVPVVMLEACRGAQVSDRPVFGALAPTLLRSGVGSVIAYSHSVHVAAARIVSERFYRALASGGTVGESVHAARGALYAERRRWLALGPDAGTVELQDWIIPQLYQSGNDPALVPEGAAPGLAVPDGRSIEIQRGEEIQIPGFPPAPLDRFHGRDRELWILEHALRRPAAVLIHAFGGMGKTALTREAAHWWVRTGRFEHAIFHSFEQGAGAEAVVRLIGESLGGEGFLHLSPDAQWARAVRLFRESLTLLVWDNYESVLPAFSRPAGSVAPAASALVGSAVRTESGTDGTGEGPHSGPYEPFDDGARAELERLYRELTEGQPRGRLLVTCRPQETGLAGIRAIRLDGLARPDALHLLRGIVEREHIDLERPGWERAEIDALLDRLEDHPLSIELVAPHLKTLKPATIRVELAERIAQFEDPSRPEGRNRSLLASLDFSRRHLSAKARAALDWLGWFEGGMFEAFLLDFSQIPESDWSAIRAELTATALLRVEDLPWINTPYLKLPPIRAYAASPVDRGDGERVGRFVSVYLEVSYRIHEALRGSQPAVGMALMGLEQSNLRRAMGYAFDSGQHREGGLLAGTLAIYLEQTGLLRERNRLVDWVRRRVPEDRLDAAACAAILDHAWSLVIEGHAHEALHALLDLERRLSAPELDHGNRALHLAMVRCYRGRILLHTGHPDSGLEPLEQSIAAFRAVGADQRGNLSVALGSLANALTVLGRYDQAMAAADEGLTINRALGRDREVAVGLAQFAAILLTTGHYTEAEDRYREALEAAERVGDLGLQGALLQHLGSLQQDTGRTAESVETLHKALRSFHQSGNRDGEMKTCDWLGSAERELGRLDPAEAWYSKSLALAEALGDRSQIAVTRHNLGLLLQNRAESILTSAPRSISADAERERLLAAAVTEIESSLAIEREMGNRLGAASSHIQLGILHRLCGDLERAETESLRSLEIFEPLNHPDLWKVYSNLSNIAVARGDAPRAADWHSKRDAKLAELKRLAAGPDLEAHSSDASDRAVMKTPATLAQSVYQSRIQRRPPEPDIAEALAQLANSTPPFGHFGAFLQAIARFDDPPPPPGLPEPLAQLAADLLDALARGP